MNRWDTPTRLPGEREGSPRKPGDVIFFALLIAAVGADWLRDRYQYPLIPTFLAVAALSITMGFGIQAWRQRMGAHRRSVRNTQWEWTKLGLASVVLGASVSYLLHESRQWPIPTTFAAVVLGIATAAYLLVRLQQHSLRQLFAAGAPIGDEVLSLSREEARHQANALLANPLRFEREAGKPTPEARALTATLHPSIRRFLETHFVAKSVRCGLVLGSRFVKMSQALPEFITIGYLGLPQTELAVKPGEEMVYVLAHNAPPDDRQEATFPSIYHCILYEERLQEAFEQVRQRARRRRKKG